MLWDSGAVETPWLSARVETRGYSPPALWGERGSPKTEPRFAGCGQRNRRDRERINRERQSDAPLMSRPVGRCESIGAAQNRANMAGRPAKAVTEAPPTPVSSATLKLSPSVGFQPLNLGLPLTRPQSAARANRASRSSQALLDRFAKTQLAGRVALQSC